VLNKLLHSFISVGRTMHHTRCFSPAYHGVSSSSKRLVERFHRQLKDALRARLDNHDWTSHLPWVMLGLRAAPKEDCGISSKEMVYGEALTIPGDFLEASTPPADGFLQQVPGSSLRPRGQWRPSRSLIRRLLFTGRTSCTSEGGRQPLHSLLFTRDLTV
jgi:hypothetical protein